MKPFSPKPRPDFRIVIGSSLLVSLVPVQAATVISHNVAIARLDETTVNTPPDSTITDQGDVVTAAVTGPTISLVGPDFTVASGSGSVSVSRDGPPPGGGRNLLGTTATTVIEIVLQPGETLTYNIELAFDVIHDQGAGEQLLGWAFRNFTTSNVYFAENITVATQNGIRTESGSITATGTETLIFEVLAELNDTSIVRNSEASASWTSFTFSGDSNIPEPSVFALLLAGCAPLLARRR